MSDTIYIKLSYRSRLRDAVMVQQLIHETEDICRSSGWMCQMWDKVWSKPANLTLTFTGKALEFEGHAPLKGLTFSIGGGVL